MAHNKNQHFVPRCHLRPFSRGGTGRSIGLLNIARDLHVPSAAVAHQCSGDYFYGHDQVLEAFIQRIESEYSGVIRSLQNQNSRVDDGAKEVLKRFWVTQHLRTEQASRRMVEMGEEFRNVVGALAEDFSFGVRDAVSMAMKQVPDGERMLSDIKIGILRNRTSVPFVTSDDPAVLTNRLQLQLTPAPLTSFGLHSAGLLLLLPLTPTELMIGYDGDVYSINHTDGIADIDREGDVLALNEHQFLNCRSNIYFSQGISVDQVRSAYEAVRLCRIEKRHTLVYAVFDSKKDGVTTFRAVDPASAGEHKRAMIHQRTVFPKPSRWPRVVNWRNMGTAFSNGSGLGLVRRREIQDRGGLPFKKVRIEMGRISRL